MKVSAETGAAVMGYRPELDGLRALAVSAVFAYHALPDRFPGGWLGVDLFFVLSGFLITTLLLEEHDRGGVDLRAFWVRRVRRLMPASLLVVAVCAVWVDGLWWVLGYSANWAMASNVELGPLGHLWSLAVEEQFYVAWPMLLVVMLARRVNPEPVVLALVGLVTVWRWVLLGGTGQEARAYFSTDTRVDALLIGCLVAFTLHRLPWHRFVGPVAALVLAALVVLAPPVGPGLELVYTPVGVASAGVVAWVVRERPAALRSPLLVWIGLRSYGIYLWHWPILWAMQEHGTTEVRWTLAAAILTLMTAAANYRWVEQPFRSHALSSADALR